ncbi:protein of unknown function [Methylocella tundrae]|uniref:Uncharacterized protein n=2 Tax=Methylocella tundrae TaxID=227605 RepID=A0A4U8YYZ7_METTU|nr:protein of unknown function [Methylocella tundrae]
MNQTGLAIGPNFVIRREALKKYFLCVSGEMSKVATRPNKAQHWNMHETCVAHFGSSKAAAGDQPAKSIKRAWRPFPGGLSISLSVKALLDETDFDLL